MKYGEANAALPASQGKVVIAAGAVRVSRVALAGGSQLGFSREELVSIVAELRPGDFCKAMTTYLDHRVWQDVYRPMTIAGPVYLKLTVLADVLIVSFKELCDEMW